MKFRYYITDLVSGDVKGTNDTQKALELADSEEHFVVEGETGTWLLPYAERQDVQEFKG